MTKTSREYWAEWEERTGYQRAASQGRRDKAALPQVKRTWVDKRPDHIPTDESWQQHFTGNPNSGGKPSAERAKVHESLIDEAVNKVERANPKHKFAILTMGGPGSGKSSLTSGVDGAVAVKTDPDAIKEKLPEWKSMTRPESTWRNAAWSLHEESTYVARKIRDRAIGDGKNLVIDGTGRDSDMMLDQIRNLKAEGYKISVVYAHLSAENGLARAKNRSEGSGRYVPDDVVRNVYDLVPKSFKRIAKEIDNFEVFDNTEKIPRRVWSKKDGVETEDDPEFVARYRSL